MPESGQVKQIWKTKGKDLTRNGSIQSNNRRNVAEKRNINQGYYIYIYIILNTFLYTKKYASNYYDKMN